MAIEYTEEKRFTVEQVEALFKSVGWESAQWPERLFKALQHSDTVISAWDGVVPEKLRTLDRGRPWRDSQFASTRL
ncbi:hypothetical protein, partial [Bifidobacterium longum]|uniref:hypothetical protein n=1 Tax=Bifidobacterium longum TaxID=216816 RepID=UPI0032C0699A